MKKEPNYQEFMSTVTGVIILAVLVSISMMLNLWEVV